MPVDTFNAIPESLPKVVFVAVSTPCWVTLKGASAPLARGSPALPAYILTEECAPSNTALFDPVPATIVV